MAGYVLTPARRAALEKAQEASARKRRKLHTRSRIRRNIKIGAGVSAAALAGVGTVAAYSAGTQYRANLVSERIIKRHIDLARYQHREMTSLRSHVFPMTALTALPFNEQAAREEALRILAASKNRKKRKT